MASMIGHVDRLVRRAHCQTSKEVDTHCGETQQQETRPEQRATCPCCEVLASGHVGAHYSGVSGRRRTTENNRAGRMHLGRPHPRPGAARSELRGSPNDHLEDSPSCRPCTGRG